MRRPRFDRAKWDATRSPEAQPIGSAATALYKEEERRDHVLHRCAIEQGAILGWSRAELTNRRGPYWTHAVPEALRAALEGWETTAAQRAAAAFLLAHGFTITTPDGEVLS